MEKELLTYKISIKNLSPKCSDIMFKTTPLKVKKLFFHYWMIIGGRKKVLSLLDELDELN
jgi:hypothetical protein